MPIIRRTSGTYERAFDRLFKTFEVEMVRFNRMTQGTTKSRARHYTTATREVKDCTDITIVLNYETYDLRFTLIPNLNTTDLPVNHLTVDLLCGPQDHPLIVPLDLLLDQEDLRPTFYADLLTEDVMLEAIDALLDLFRSIHHRLETFAEPKNQAALKTLIHQDMERILGQAVDESLIERWIDQKRAFALTQAVRDFYLGNHEASLKAFETYTLKGGLFEEKLKAALNAKKSKPDLIGPQMKHNYRYVRLDQKDRRHDQQKKTYVLAFVLTILPMAVIVFFVMGFTFWAITLYSFYKTGVNTWFGLIPLVISNGFAAFWAMPLAHSLLYPKDHALYRGHALRHKHDASVLRLKWSSAAMIVLMLTMSAWNGTNVMVFNQSDFSLAPGFMWIPPVEFQSYRVLDHMEFRYSISENGKTVEYSHYVLIFKDGKEVLLKPYLSLAQCEDILVPFMERKNVKTIQ